MKIGYYLRNYASERNIIGKVGNATYSKVYDLYEIPRYSIMLINKIFDRQLYDPVDFALRHSGIGLGRVDLIHFFNAVSFGAIPWITTFETLVPRLQTTLNVHHGSAPFSETLLCDTVVLKSLDAMASSRCKALIAMSKCNLRMQIEFLRLFPDHQEPIQDKLHQLYPPQPLLIERYEDKTRLPKDHLHFMFVGRLFFRKGGLEALQAFQEVRALVDQDIRLTIVSSLLDDGFTDREDAMGVEQVKAVIKANPDWVTLYSNVPNREVLELMKSAHVGLLPTCADTFGYSILEFQAAGCPVISTDVRALAEINDDSKGWLINVPKNDLGEALHSTVSERTVLSQMILQGLIAAVREVAHNPRQIRVKAENAMESIKRDHNAAHFAKELKRIYTQSLET